jgi:TonB family protein
LADNNGNVRCCLLAPLLALPIAFAQQAQAPSDVFRAGPDVKAPKVTHKVKAQYTQQAYYARVQGKVVCEVIVDEQGKPGNIFVISPLGFGLDQRAVTAVRGWKFKPGLKDGIPVKVMTLVEVEFRFPGGWYDDKNEKRRSALNVAIANMTRLRQTDEALKTVEDLARQKYLPAMHLLGRLRSTGALGPKDAEQAVALLAASADKAYAPAMHDLGIMYVEGKEVAKDTEKGLQLLRDAAVFGSRDSQLFLGKQYETGESVPVELDRARRYYRLCASSGQRECQYRLAKLMFEAPDRKEWEYLQAITWFVLAADRGVAEARKMVEAETPKLTAEQIEWVKKLRTQLVQRRR